MNRRENQQPDNQTVHLVPGAQVVINGALVTARDACALEVGSDAFVLTGRAASHDDASMRNPRDELYFSLLDCSADEARFTQERFRLYRLLGEVVAQDRTYEAQRECSQCAAALMAGDARAAVESAGRLAAERLGETPEPAPRPLPSAHVPNRVPITSSPDLQNS